MIRKISILIIISIFFSEYAMSQTVILHEKISNYDFDVPKRGPNFRHFTHLCIGYEFYIPASKENEVPIIAGMSMTFSVGVRYKYKISNFFAIGTGLNYTNDIFTIKQDNNKIFPTSATHKREKLRLNNLCSDAFIRFNFGKRGNIVGRFIDLGAYFSWIFNAKLVYKDNIKNKNSTYGADKIKVVLSDLNYINKYQYGLKTRIGMNRFVLTASYRLSEVINEEFDPIFLPRLKLGLEVGLHK